MRITDFVKVPTAQDFFTGGGTFETKKQGNYGRFLINIFGQLTVIF